MNHVPGFASLDRVVLILASRLRCTKFFRYDR